MNGAADLPPMLRHLPVPQPAWRRDADVVVVGAGAAGISAAVAAAGRGLRVLLVCKGELGGGSTPLAQGGLAAAIGPGDSQARHARDTLAAGAGLCDRAAVAGLVAGAPLAVSRLCQLGARLERTALHLEGGHSARRIITAGGDAIGAEVHRVLVRALADSTVEVLTGAVALEVLTDSEGRAAGLLVGLADGPAGQVLRLGEITARAVVLATGGFGQAYATTTNPAGVTGDGLALAARAGAELADLEFMQFHPTVAWHPGARGQCLLITEALRGAGAVLVDAAGRRVMTDQHPLGDLAPRDVVSAAMQARLEAGAGGGEGGREHLWLDATRLGRQVLEQEFPTVTSGCRDGGTDPATDPIPVAPGAHYACGGVRADLDGQTSVPGLYAVGEVAATGVHGANRLASNSVTEALIAGGRAGELIRRTLAQAGAGHLAVATAGPSPALGLGVAAEFRPVLAAAMSRYAGVMRDGEGLTTMLGLLRRAPTSDRLDIATIEATSLHAAAVSVCEAALAREESRGCHRRRDVPAGLETGEARHSLLRWDGRRLSLTVARHPEAA